jgi:hypothetical protein
MTMVETIEVLRRRFFACKGMTTMQDLEPSVGLSRQTLTRFARGGFLSAPALLRVEAWVAQQEKTRKG